MLSQERTILDDKPYTTADEDPFSVQPYRFPPNKTVKHRRSSMLDKWIIEQQAQNEDTPDDDTLPEPLPVSPPSIFTTPRPVASSSSPYLLAYPDLPRFYFETAKAKDTEDDAASIISYDLVDDDDIPEETKSEEPLKEVPVTPIPQRTHKSRHSISPSFRSINLAFSRSNSPAVPSSPNMEATSRAFARLSFFPRTPRSSVGPPSSTGTMSSQHIRASSLSTLETTPSRPSSDLPQLVASSKSRPSVLGHFSQTSISQVSIGASEGRYTPSRPSISSGDTYTSWNTSRTTTTLESAIPTSPSKFSLLDSIRVRTGKKTSRTVSGISVASTSSVGLSVPKTDGDVTISQDHCTTNNKGTITQRIPFAPKSGSSLALSNRDDEDDLDPPTYRFSKQPAIPYPSSRSLSRVKFASLNTRTSKKKKLVISGVGATEFRKLEGVRRWCESFGEVRNIMRMPNGDLQIDFRDSDVADTVCRVRAKVFIAGVGSVHMSWISGTKR